METPTKLRNGLEWAGIILALVLVVVGLEVPQVRPWIAGVMISLAILAVGRSLLTLVRGSRRFEDWLGLAFSLGVSSLAVNLIWNLRILSFVGALLMLVAAGIAKHREGRVSESPGPIAR